jgi:hypothetical protein
MEIYYTEEELQDRAVKMKAQAARSKGHMRLA